MTHKIRHKQLQTIKKKYKNLAGIVAAATILSTAALPGMPPATIAHAASNPHSSNMSATTSQQIGKTNSSGMQINFNSSVVAPTKQDNKAAQPSPSPNGNKTSNTTAKTTEQTNHTNAQPNSNPNKTPSTTAKPAGQVNPNVQPDPNLNKTPVSTAKPIEQANPNVQPDPNLNKTPVSTGKPIEQTNPNVQPDPNLNKTPVSTGKPIEQANPNVQPDPNLNKTPVTTAKPTEQANPNAQPTVNTPPSSSTNAPTNYKQVLNIKATAYAPGAHDNDQWGNKTYTGSQVRPGIIAVDPNVIPLGSRVYIEYPDGHGEYATAEDTGGAIKGNRVDIAKWTVNEAENFGIQHVKVYVVNTPEKV